MVMQRIPFLNWVMLALLPAPLIAQSIAQGPDDGTIPNGVIVNTEDFPLAPLGGGEERRVIINNPWTPMLPAPPDGVPPRAPAGSNYFEDRGRGTIEGFESVPVVVQNFEGLPDFTYIPPDPEMAVGPNHVIACVNARFRIYDKSGNIIQTINAGAWFGSAAPGLVASDPQIIYDYYDNRWVIVWGDFDDSPADLISVSDDDDPIGEWYNWALPSNQNGDMVNTNFSDYPQFGFDDQALYITGRQFGIFSGAFQYSKIRIVGKAQLYANTAGPVTWTDFWDLRDPAVLSTKPDGVQPSVAFDSPGTAFFMNSSPFVPGNYLTLWKVESPLSSPTISAVNIPVTQYSTATNANQLGGSTILIEAGGSRLRGQPVYRDSSLHVVHSVASGTGNQYSAIHYVRMNPFTETVLDDMSMGLDGFWHYYTALMATEDSSVVITFSRSGTTEYIGAFVSGRNVNDPPGLASSVPIKSGEANYVKDFGSGRNRWGDYMGIGLDPVEPDAIWALTEYASSPSSTWGTWFGKVNLVNTGAYVRVDPGTYSFGVHEVGTSSDTLNVSVVSTGVDTLMISAISLSTPHFVLTNPPSLPFGLAAGDTLTLSVAFVPQVHGSFLDTLRMTSNAVNSSGGEVAFDGDGFIVTPAEQGVLYTVTGTIDLGRLYRVDPDSGTATLIGSTGYTQVVSARVHPVTQEIIGLVPSGSNHLLVRINSLFGDAHEVSVITLTTLKGMSFRNDTLYIGRISGQIYSVDINTGASTLVASTGINIAGLAFHPITGQLWASVRIPASPADRIYKIDLTSGTATLVGSSGVGQISDILFDGRGNLYGIAGTGAITNDLVSIDTTTGAATVIGSMGIMSAQGLAARADFGVGVRETQVATLPTKYSLEQNYPNPFNPATDIRYGLPEQSDVTLSIYNLLGQEIARLHGGVQEAGYHVARWDGTSAAGRSVSSGLYFYRLEARGASGRQFISIKKMLLLK